MRAAIYNRGRAFGRHIVSVHDNAAGTGLWRAFWSGVMHSIDTRRSSPPPASYISPPVMAGHIEPAEALRLLDERRDLRAQRRYQEADAIRARLIAANIATE